MLGRSLPASLLALAVAAGAFACEPLSPPQVIVQGGGADAGDGGDVAVGPIPAGAVRGAPTTLYGANIESWALVDAQGILTEWGFVIPLSIVQAFSAPNLAFTQNPIAIPDVVPAQSTTQALRMDQIPIGHVPVGVYDFAHFEIHLFTQAEQKSVDCKNKAQPEPAIIPPDFFVDGSAGLNCLPEAGIHAFNSKAEEFNGTRFTQTTALTYYDNKLLSIEPKVTNQLLLSRTPEVNFAFDAAAGMAKLNLAAPKLHPSKMQAKYFAALDVYGFTISNLVTKQ